MSVDWVLHVYMLYTPFGQTDRNTVVVLIKYAYLNVFIDETGQALTILFLYY